MNFSASCGWTISVKGKTVSVMSSPCSPLLLEMVHFAGLVPAFHRVEDDVLLQHAVVAEGGLAGFKDVEAAQFQVTQESLRGTGGSKGRCKNSAA